MIADPLWSCVMLLCGPLRFTRGAILLGIQSAPLLEDEDEKTIFNFSNAAVILVSSPICY